MSSPLVPPAVCLDRYRTRTIDSPASGAWVAAEAAPNPVRMARQMRDAMTAEQTADVRRAFHAQCTHIDHQIRLLIGTLVEEDLIDDTIIVFASDHGDMLGDHGIYAKRLMYEGSAHIPLIVVDTAAAERVPAGQVDARLAGLQDVMPTLLELCGIKAPEMCDGRSLLTGERRKSFYSEWGTGPLATRMVHDGRYKMIWYPAGNRFQLFDLAEDPHELNNIADDASHAKTLGRLRTALAANFYGRDTAQLRDNKIYGIPEPRRKFRPACDLARQRGPSLPLPAPRAASTGDKEEG